ncbi:hypothetical protein [Sulfurimonas sp.]|uniref:hypothetical protein n=1 Tax=Sulfurimonas sp. TaxID=2022749 RepID=UPI0026069334|nr:hypothetical protein [Sulfurimonas sp.]MDD3855648.1 hypothetical protein [Sulfurimonas sp.]
MKPYIQEEIRAITFNINVIVEKLQSGELSTTGNLAAVELIKTLSKVKSYIKNKEAKNIDLILSKLPLLYFHIPKLN